MSKRPTTPAAKRPNPPDRDGDGKPGGSLPGNETVDAAKGPEAETAPAETGTAPETAPAETGTPPETAPSETGTAAETAPAETAWSRDNAAILDDLLLVDEGWAVDDLNLQNVEAWTDDQAKEAQAWAAAMAGRAEGDAEGPPPPDCLKPHLGGDTPAAEATFTAEEIAAGKTPVAEQEGEAERTAAEAAEPAQAELVTIDPEGPTDQAVAVRLDELRRLIDNRWLYKGPHGYSPSYSAPFVSQETVDAWLAAGLCEDRPSAGREGGVFVTPKAVRAVARGSV